MYIYVVPTDNFFSIHQLYGINIDKVSGACGRDSHFFFFLHMIYSQIENIQFY